MINVNKKIAKVINSNRVIILPRGEPLYKFQFGEFTLGDGIHFFSVDADKYSGEPVAKLFNANDKEKKALTILTVGERTHHKLINYFEAWVIQSKTKN